MQELTRFLQLRQTQKLSDEQKQQIGIPLYPNGKASKFAKDLKDANNVSDKFNAVVNEYIENTKGITNLSQIDPILKSLYEWLEFKSKPISYDDFKRFVLTLSGKEPSLITDWNIYADNLLITFHQQTLGTNSGIDFQHLIRVCFIYRECIEYKDNRYSIKGGENRHNPILNSSILLPAGAVLTRCAVKNESFNLMNVGNSTSYCICIKTYVADLFTIKEELARYEEGDVADIENILAGEKKVRKHNTTFRTEDATEEETQRESADERDHQVTEKFSLQNEIKKTQEEKSGLDAGVTSTLKYGDMISITPHANFTSSDSKSNAESTARNYAKDIVDRSTTKVQEKVRKAITSKVLNEIIEKNKHSIDNSQAGAKNRAGLFYWINKVTHAQVFNHGKHMMFDAIIPEPAATFKKLFKNKVNKDLTTLIEPLKPSITLDDIKRDDYLTHLNKYAITGVENYGPPDEFVYIQFGFSVALNRPPIDNIIASEFRSPQIPDGYKARNMSFDIIAYTSHPGSDDFRNAIAVTVNLGNTRIFDNSMDEENNSNQGRQKWYVREPDPVNSPWIVLNGEEGTLLLEIAGFSNLKFSISGTIVIRCELKDSMLERWKLKIYDLIMTDYNKKLEAYNQSIASKQSQLYQIKGRNPFLNREIERNELKRHLIAMLMCNYFDDIKGAMVSSDKSVPEIDFKNLENDAPIIQFFEQVFEWNYVSYLFYHSMWARKSEWENLIDEDSGDPLFDKFLTAGAARVQVPIRYGMEETFNLFLQTGQIWRSSSKPPIPGEIEYVSMIQELRESKQCDYTDRSGFIEAIQGSNQLKLSESTFYWNFNTEGLGTLNISNIKNDIDRELLLNYKIYRIVSVTQDTATLNSTWIIEIERKYEDESATNLKHAVGDLYVGAPWEVIIPTKLVYLRDEEKLPVYPLN